MDWERKKKFPDGFPVPFRVGIPTVGRRKPVVPLARFFATGSPTHTTYIHRCTYTCIYTISCIDANHECSPILRMIWARPGGGTGSRVGIPAKVGWYTDTYATLREVVSSHCDTITSGALERSGMAPGDSIRRIWRPSDARTQVLPRFSVRHNPPQHSSSSTSTSTSSNTVLHVLVEVYYTVRSPSFFLSILCRGVGPKIHTSARHLTTLHTYLPITQPITCIIPVHTTWDSYHEVAIIGHATSVSIPHTQQDRCHSDSGQWALR
jgi:hypothetical protein